MKVLEVAFHCWCLFYSRTLYGHCYEFTAESLQVCLYAYLAPTVLHVVVLPTHPSMGVLDMS